MPSRISRSSSAITTVVTAGPYHARDRGRRESTRACRRACYCSGRSGVARPARLSSRPQERRGPARRSGERPTVLGTAGQGRGRRPFAPRRGWLTAPAAGAPTAAVRAGDLRRPLGAPGRRGGHHRPPGVPARGGGAPRRLDRALRRGRPLLRPYAPPTGGWGDDDGCRGRSAVAATDVLSGAAAYTLSRIRHPALSPSCPDADRDPRGGGVRARVGSSSSSRSRSPWRSARAT